ncbi:MAG: class II aldolase/adducin family protein [Kiritimatiellae bacterium]|nr:class II aldolase/adducin family protein [Kiritimatiellia bacterium]
MEGVRKKRENVRDARSELVLYGRKIVEAGLVAGAGGNISVREDRIVWMKPSGLAMDEIEVEDLCGMDLESGRQVVGRNKPTSEVNMHLAVYRVRPDVYAVFHTHSPWASGVISAGVKLRPMFAEFVNDLGRTGTLEYVTPTTERLATAMARKVKTCDTVFMVNHGVLAVGACPRQAFYRVCVVEDAAKSLVAACAVGKPRFLTRRQVAEILSLDAVRYRAQMMGRKG